MHIQLLKGIELRRFFLPVKSVATVSQTPFKPSTSSLRLTFVWVWCRKSICTHILHASTITNSLLPDCNVSAEVESCRQSHCCQLKCVCVCLWFSFNNFAFFSCLCYYFIYHTKERKKARKTFNALEWKLIRILTDTQRRTENV